MTGRFISGSTSFVDRQGYPVTMGATGATMSLTWDNQAQEYRLKVTNPNFFVLPDIASILSEIEGNTTISDEERQARKDEAMSNYAIKAERVHTVNFGSQDHVLVPDEALVKQMGAGDRYVYVYDAQKGTVSYNKVIVGKHMGKNYEIISGIKHGDQVVIAGQARLADGRAVEVVK